MNVRSGCCLPRSAVALTPGQSGGRAAAQPRSDQSAAPDWMRCPDRQRRRLPIRGGAGSLHSPALPRRGGIRGRHHPPPRRPSPHLRTHGSPAFLPGRHRRAHRGRPRGAAVRRGRWRPWPGSAARRRSGGRGPPPSPRGPSAPRPGWTATAASLQLGDELEPVHLRHHQVQQDQRRAAPRERLPSAAAAVLRLGDRPALLARGCGAASSRVAGVVLDDQDAARRRRSGGTAQDAARRSRSTGLVR